MFWIDKYTEYTRLFDRLISLNSLGLFSNDRFYLMHSYDIGNNKFRLYGDALVYKSFNIIKDRYVDVKLDDVANISKQNINYTISELFYWASIYNKADLDRFRIRNEITENAKIIKSNEAVKGDFLMAEGEIYYTTDSFKSGDADLVKISRGDQYELISSSGVKFNKLEETYNLITLFELYKTIVDSKSTITRHYNYFMENKRS